jgi:hypothetical protein
VDVEISGPVEFVDEFDLGKIERLLAHQDAAEVRRDMAVEGDDDSGISSSSSEDSLPDLQEISPDECFTDSDSDGF